MIRIGCTSDLHFTGKKISDLRIDKLNNLRLFRREHPDIILVAGDLTDDGYDGMWYPFKTNNQYRGFIQWLHETERIAPTYCVHGNHDTYVKKPYWSQPLRYDMIARYGYTFYSRTIGDYKLLALGQQPMDSKYSVKQLLRNNRDHLLVIMFHYNLVGDYSDFWPQSDKEAFWKLLKPYYHQVICLIHGHIHVNQDYQWEPETGYPVQCYGVGGDGIGILKIDHNIPMMQFHTK